MYDEQRNTVWRFAIIFIAIFIGFAAVLGRIIYIAIFIGFAAVLGRIIYIQAFEREAWLKVAEQQVPTHRPIAATRGNILDCNGRLLASSMPQYYMYMDTRVEALHQKNGQLFNRHIDTLALDLATIVGEHTQAKEKRA